MKRATEGETRHGGARVLRVLGRGLVVLLAFLLVPGVVFVISAHGFDAAEYARPATTTGSTAAVDAANPPGHDPGKPTVAIVVGNSGANVADTLVPYDMLAGTGAFNVYTVAAERRLVPLQGGLDLVPDLDFRQLSRRLGGEPPDVTVVPDMPDFDEVSDRHVTTWLRDTASRGLVLSVCTGARLVAEAGLLDGQNATTHWYRLAGLRDDHPAVHWRRGTRYVDDGTVITTGGLLSSVDGTLRVIERLAGTETAAAAARRAGWRHYSPGTPATLPVSRLTPSNAIVHLLNLGYRSDTTAVGVVLTNGVGELELASAFSPYAEVEAGRTVALASTPTVRSRHGLTFVPRARLTGGAADDVDRLLVPGRTAAARPDPEVAAIARAAGVAVEYPHRRPEFAFDPVLRSMSRNLDRPTARWTGKILEHPATGLRPSDRGWPWAPTLRLLLLGLAGVAALVIVRVAAHLIPIDARRSWRPGTRR